MKNIVNSEVDTPDGKATLKEIYVTELGYIMAKIYYPKKRISINYKIGNVEELLESKKLDVLLVPKGYVSSIQALEKGAKLLVMSDYLFGAIQDEYRFDIDYFK